VDKIATRLGLGRTYGKAPPLAPPASRTRPPLACVA
jgi:hypothetical protein